MKNIICLIIITLFCSCAFSQSSEEEITTHRANHLVYLLDTTSGWLSQEEVDQFGGLDYFDFDESFQITAKFTKDKGRRFKMPTSTDRLPVYRRYGYLDFSIGDSSCRLEVYQNMKNRRKKGNKNYLFIPFRDATTRNSTYGGGRFMDITITESDTILLDFNLAYNPYCAYTYNASCPIPPAANTLTVKISAGEKTPIGH
ncbi:MAG: DUF1684 domain-containing protein [Crocinitomicaceae bacterium]|nr:DUF1684 domain-containing protein [Flavobacteriales bacterium]NQZ35207.1 DUF1684 domain-containing protein [Crocinitomicaceae bacterium]